MEDFSWICASSLNIVNKNISEFYDQFFLDLSLACACVCASYALFQLYSITSKVPRAAVERKRRKEQATTVKSIAQSTAKALAVLGSLHVL